MLCWLYGLQRFWGIFGWLLPALELLDLSLGCAHGTVSGLEVTEGGQRCGESGQKM